jgi:outer membrane protein insertion porin family
LKLTFYALEFTRIKDFYRYNQTGTPGFVDNTTLLVDVAKIGPTFEWDYRNDIFNPTRGTDTILQLFYSDPIIGSSGDSQQYVHFFKTENSVTNYLPVTKSERWIWVNQVRSGYIANLSQNSDVYRGQPVSGYPSTETKLLGGATTIRGFDVNEKIPNIYDLQPNGNGDISSFKYTVESYYYLLKSELRFPLYKAFGGAIFYDAGGVFANQPGTNSPDTYRDSAGFGIRLNTPVGPINLDLGFKLHRRLRYAGTQNAPQEESPFAFHFTVGNF